jgi:uncharacterized repeat protein (TIGR03803 family)
MPVEQLPSLTSSYGYEILYKFPGSGADGGTPLAGVIDVNGALYGTTAYGGDKTCTSYGCGTVFTLDSTGTEHVLHEFAAGADGEFPAASMINVNGVLYGTTAGNYGGNGPSGFGTVFSILPDGSHYRVLYSFAGGADGSYPLGSVVAVRGTLFGTTYEGGQDGLGTVFELGIKDGKEQILHSFAGGTDGAKPMSGLVDVLNTLYGTTSQGGISKNQEHNAGTVFKLNRRNDVEIVFTFDVTDGEAPSAPLLEIGRTLYGTTVLGGTYNWGTVFALKQNGLSERVLHSFDMYSTDGWFPETGLVSLNGLLYGTTSGGGLDNGGVLYSIQKDGQGESIVHSFGTYRDGSDPNSLITEGTAIYGTTQNSSGSGADGSIWSFSP